MLKRGWLWLVLLGLFVWASCTAEVVWCGPGNTFVRSTVLEEEWLFLPSGADLSALALSVDGAEVRTVDWLKNSEENPKMSGVLTGTLDGRTLHVMRSENLRSVHIFSHDPVDHGRSWVEDCDRHQNETTVSAVFLRADGTPYYTDELVELRGRGNNTWSDTVKKPYQLKLSERSDLLEQEEAVRTWVLLSHNRDESMLHNQLAMDMARELGLTSTPLCEQTDLFYDGEYRGTYLLSEKITVDKNGVDIVDFDELLTEINRRMGTPDPDVRDVPTMMEDGLEVPVPDGVNDLGLRYGYADGAADHQDVDAGGYLLELEGLNSLSDHTWFEISNNRYIGVKNPEYAGETMMRYISELFENAFQAMVNLGEHPITGEPLEHFIDIDSFTRSHLVQEWMLSEDGYEWSSTFFILPQGGTKLFAGPVWDFDRIIADYPRLKDDNAFSHAFYRTTVFQRKAKEICQNELEPLLNDVLFGGGTGRWLKPLAAYQEAIAASWRMNYYLYSAQDSGWANAQENFDSQMGALEHFLSEQSRFLLDEVASWAGDAPAHEADITFELVYGDTDNLLFTYMEDETQGNLWLKDTVLTCLSPATEDEYALWQADFLLSAKPGCRIEEDLVVRVNGEEYVGDRTDTQVRLSFTFRDPSYRPAILEGEDYGHVFNYDYYVENVPESTEEGDDLESVLRYFCEWGMEYGDMGNEFFDPIQMLETFSYLTDSFGGEWPAYYKAFCREPSRWAEEMGNTYQPELMEK